MAAREVGIPAYGLITAAGGYYVSTYVDDIGWVAVDVTSREPVFQPVPSGLVTRAPTLAAFEASADELWMPNAGAYSERMGAVRALSWTEWNPVPAGEDATRTSSLELGKACP
jgi:hypothetical protein